MKLVYLKDISLCIVASIFLLFIGEDVLKSEFFQSFSQSFLEIIFAVFAINIASTALVAQLLNQLSEKSGASFEKSRSVMMAELKIQGIMLVVALFLLIVYNSKLTSDSAIFQFEVKLKYWSKIGLIAIFLYFVWLTHDLGKSLFDVLSVKFPNQKK